MHKISANLPQHKRLVLDIKPPRESIKIPIKMEQKTLKSHSSEFNIHRTISKGKSENATKPHPIPQHRQSESLQNYLKLKLKKQIEPRRATKRLSLRHSLFDSVKENITFYPSTAETINIYHLVDQVLTHLKEHFQLEPKTDDELVISRSSLKEVMGKTIELIISKHLHQQPPHCNCRQLNTLLAKLTAEIEKQMKQKSIQRLAIDSCVYSSKWGGGQFEGQVIHSENRLLHLQSECQSLQYRIMKLSSFQQSLKQQCKNAQQSLQQHKRQFQQVQNKKCEQQQQLKSINERVKQAEYRLFHTLQEQASMCTYSSQQRTHQILRLISEDYKNIESDIYEYAVYLQSNQLASDLQYQPYPFKQLEEQIQTDQKQLMASLNSHNKALSLQKKVGMAQEFVEEAMCMLWRKDGEMRRMVDFKTKCIYQFVNNMKKWLSNREMKQEFLRNLRKQFAADCTKLRQVIQRLQAKSNNCEQIEIVKEMVEKLIENYKMGNSFY